MPYTPTGAPGKPNGMGIDENVANGAVDDYTDYDDDSDDYNEFGNTKKERAKSTMKKRKTAMRKKATMKGLKGLAKRQRLRHDAT